MEVYLNVIMAHFEKVNYLYRQIIRIIYTHFSVCTYREFLFVIYKWSHIMQISNPLQMSKCAIEQCWNKMCRVFYQAVNNVTWTINRNPLDTKTRQLFLVLNVKPLLITDFLGFSEQSCGDNHWMLRFFVMQVVYFEY